MHQLLSAQAAGSQRQQLPFAAWSAGNWLMHAGYVRAFASLQTKYCNVDGIRDRRANATGLVVRLVVDGHLCANVHAVAGEYCSFLDFDHCHDLTCGRSMRRCTGTVLCSRRCCLMVRNEPLTSPRHLGRHSRLFAT